jgi:hypothetical protein
MNGHERKRKPEQTPAAPVPAPAQRQVSPTSQITQLQQQAGNQAVTQLLTTPARPEFQPNVMRSDELDAIMTALSTLRFKSSPEVFHEFMGRNEVVLYEVLKRYGYRGSWVKPEGTIRDFDEAYQKWVAAGEVTGFAVGLPIPQPAPDPWQDVWRTAGSDPIAALWIAASVLVSETLGRTFGFSVDPERLAGGAQAGSTLIQMLAAAKPGSANPWIVPRAGAATGPPRVTTQEGPFPIVRGEIKPITPSAVAEGRRKLLGTYSVGLGDTAMLGLLTYDQFGNVYAEQYLAGGFQQLVWEGPIGRIPPERLPKQPFGTSEYGNLMEPLVRGVLSERTGQYFQEGKHPSASGPDIELRAGLIRMNLLRPKD